MGCLSPRNIAHRRGITEFLRLGWTIRTPHRRAFGLAPSACRLPLKGGVIESSAAGSELESMVGGKMMEKTTTSDLDDIVSLLLSVDPYRIVLFGSAASGEQVTESDIDLLAILDSRVIPRTFSERMETRITVRNRVRAINRNIPVDLVVYTRSEYELIRTQGASFLNRIEPSGKTLYVKSSESVALNGTR